MPAIKYRVWVVTNFSGEPRYYSVKSPEEGKRMIDAIANEHLIVPDDIIESNTFGLQVFNENWFSHNWQEWEDEDGCDINEAFED